MTCQEVVEVLTDYLDGALGADDVARLEAHLHGCDGCTAYLAQFRATTRLAAAAGVDVRPDREALRALFRGFRR
jgi:anti-sigma factor RsiW